MRAALRRRPVQPSALRARGVLLLATESLRVAANAPGPTVHVTYPIWEAVGLWLNLLRKWESGPISPITRQPPGQVPRQHG